MRRGILIYNPNAGRFPSRMLAERAGFILRNSGWDLSILSAPEKAQITEYSRQAAQAKLNAVFVAGGDGSINLAVRGLIGSNTALGVLPAGTSNVWAQELGLPGLNWTRWAALQESARILANAEERYVDVGFCNGHPFLMWAGVGLDGFVVHRIEPRGRWVKLFPTIHYTASTFVSASFWHGMNLKVIADGRQVIGHYLVAVVSNIHLYAGGLAEISPNALLDDQRMDLWLFEGEDLGDVIRVAWSMLSGQHVHSDQVKYIPFEELILESESLMYIQADGDPIQTEKPVRIGVNGCSLKVLVPDKTPRKLFLHGAGEHII